MTDQASEGSQAASIEAPLEVAEPTGLQVITDPAHPFAKAFISTVAVLVAVALAAATVALSSILIMIGVSLFLALALDPVVRRLESRAPRCGAVFHTAVLLLQWRGLRYSPHESWHPPRL